ncbi:MAG: hypothetical protein ACI9C2_001850, partial [Gammaproteobacteria bacterium]
MAKRKAKKKKGSSLLEQTNDWLMGLFGGGASKSKKKAKKKASKKKAAEPEVGEHLQEIKGLLMLGFAAWLVVSMATFYKPIDDALAEGHNW